MEDVLIECSPGISGDMLLGAFYDLGVPKKVIEQPLIDIGFKNLYNLEFKESKSCSIRGIITKVENIDCGPPNKRDWRSIKEHILNGNLAYHSFQKLDNILVNQSFLKRNSHNYHLYFSCLEEIIHLRK